jgi:hypothetical protein
MPWTWVHVALSCNASNESSRAQVKRSGNEGPERWLWIAAFRRCPRVLAMTIPSEGILPRGLATARLTRRRRTLWGGLAIGNDGRARLLNGRRRHQHESAKLVVVCGVGGVHGGENLGRLDPDRRILVARDVEDEEAVGLSVIGSERRNMAAVAGAIDSGGQLNRPHVNGLSLPSPPGPRSDSQTEVALRFRLAIRAGADVGCRWPLATERRHVRTPSTY